MVPAGSHPGAIGTIGTLTKGFSCKVLATDPPLDSNKSAGRSFNAHWTIQNDGTELWDSANTDYSYASGTKMYVGDRGRDLDVSIASGETLEIIIEMKAPKASGVYTTVWQLHSGQEFFCPMTIRINV
jgi:alkaline phosphatase